MSGGSQPFRFNFGGPCAESESPLKVVSTPNFSSSSLPPCLEITVPDRISDSGQGEAGTVAIDEDRGIYLTRGNVGTSSVPVLPETSDSDLIPGKYEGGFKLWECAIDLSEHLCQAFNIRATQEQWSCALPRGTRVLELGCGHGLPGILLMLAGCEVHFQDYNSEVLQALTALNVRSNFESHPEVARLRRQQPRYFAGDWAMLPDLLDSRGLLGSYDIILAAETIYNLDSQKQLLQCIKKCLQPATGQAWIAAKSCYFGVGGGTATFKALLASDQTFSTSTAAVVDDGVSNKREILLLRHRGTS